jgi:hypothetical protein
METIQYSLNNSKDYSIDINRTIINSKQEKSKYVQEKLKYVHKHNEDSNNIFDEYCLNIYGKKTCIFFEIASDVFQVRFLDKNKTNSTYNNIKRSQFYVDIPTLVEKSYTVIIVENIPFTNTKEIVAIHSSPNTM